MALTDVELRVLGALIEKERAELEGRGLRGRRSMRFSPDSFIKQFLSRRI